MSAVSHNAARLPTSMDDIVVSKHIAQQSRDRKVYRFIIEEAIENGVPEQDGEDEFRLIYDDPNTVDTYVIPIVQNHLGEWVLKTCYRMDT